MNTARTERVCRISTQGVRSWVSLLGLAGLMVVSLPAASQVERQDDGGRLGARAVHDPRLDPVAQIVPLDQARGQVSPAVLEAWERFRAGARSEWQASVDRLTGQVVLASGGGIVWIPAQEGSPLTTGPGRELSLADLERTARGFLPQMAPFLGVDPQSLVLNRGRSGQPVPQVWWVDFDVRSGGETIEGARVLFRVNHGKLIQLGSEDLPTPGAKAPAPVLDREKAQEVVSRHIGGFTAADSFRDAGSLHLIPVTAAPGVGTTAGGKRGRGLAHVWQFVFHREGELGTWRARVDAASGELLELVDVNEYAQATGGVYANSPATGPEIVRPFPFLNLSAGGPSNSAGLYSFGGGALTSSLDGTFVHINDSCGAISLAADGSGNLAFGTSGGTDCTTPGFGGAGNTHAAREQFYQVNRAKEAGRGWLPANGWLNAKLTVNVNTSQVCNAYWNGSTLNFFKALAPCANTGEISGVSLHEYGHGLDSNDGNGGPPENGSGETTGDFTSVLALHDSCIGPGFRPTNCTGYGDACSSCTGVRDIDWAKHPSNAPHTVANFTQTLCPQPKPTNPNYVGPCGRDAMSHGVTANKREGHCESIVSSEALWDFVARDLPSPGSSAAWSVVERLWYTGRPSLTNYFSCDTTGATWTSNGCAVGSLWEVFRSLDDDDGDLGNGTPHGGALFAAFNRHGIACAGDPGASTTSSGCTPPAVPALTATGGANQVSLTWTASAGAVYDVLRNESGCQAGFTKIAPALATTSYVDTAVANGSTYYYQVLAYPAATPACAAQPSTCLAVTLGGPDPSIRPWGVALEPPTVPYYQTQDIWVDNNGGIPNELGEPSRGKADNQLFARVTNNGNADASGYRVSFAFKAYTTNASAPPVAIDHQDEAGTLAPGASRSYSVTWDLTDAFLHAHFDPMFWTADHFCVQVTIGSSGGPLVDANPGNNFAQNNFDNVPVDMLSGIASARFFLYNHLDHAALASLRWIVHRPGWTVRFENVGDPARIPLQPRQWLEVTAVAVPGPDAPRPRPGEPVLIDVSQQLDGAEVGGLTLALQPPREDHGGNGGNGTGTGTGSGGPGLVTPWLLSLTTGIGWPVGTMHDLYDPGPHFGLELDRLLSPRLRVGLQAGYHAFPIDPGLSGGNLGVTHLALVVRALGTAGVYRPFVQAGVGSYRLLGRWRSGLQAGVGLEVPVTARIVLTGGSVVHRVNGPRGDLHWVDAFLGFGFGLP